MSGARAAPRVPPSVQDRRELPYSNFRVFLESAAGALHPTAMHSFGRSLVAIVSLVAGSAAVAATAPSPILAANWPQFRGPRGDGVALHANPPSAWNADSNVAWKVALTGRGRSSPVILDGRVFVTSAVERNVVRKRIGPDDMQTAEHVSLRAACLDLESGRTLWEVTLFDVPNPDPVHWLNSWATPTPAVEPGRVYCEFGTFGTACLDTESGRVIWSRIIPTDHQVGPGSSPVLWKDRLFLVRDGREAQYVAALNKATGETVWRTERPPIEASSPNLKKSFSTPLLAEHGGRLQLIAPGPHWTCGYEPETGQELWRVRHGKGFSIGTAPVVGHGLAFFGTGCFKAELWAVRLGGSNDVTESNFAWKTLRQVPVMSSPLLVGDELYWVSDDGMATCADARTGQVHWQERLGGPTLASPLNAGDRVYFFRQDGRATVVKRGKELVKVSENVLEGTLIATPAVSGDSLLMRTDTHMYRIAQAR